MSIWRTVSHRGEGRKVVAHTDLVQSSHLYHYLPWKFAVALVENQRLRLSPVRSWPDPYERWWCEQLFSAGGALEGVNAYGFCWTTSHFDEPAWRMNGFGRDPIVRIKVCVSDLISAARRADSTASLYLTPMKYRPEQFLRRKAAAFRNAKHSSRTAAQLLRLKRNAFRFENEVRLLWFDRGAAAAEQFLPIDRSDICQVMINPHSDTAEREVIATRFREIGVRTVQSKVLALLGT